MRNKVTLWFTPFLDEVYKMVYDILMDKYDEIILRQLEDTYYDERELRYGTRAKTFLSSIELRELAKRKVDKANEGNDERFVKLDLFAFDAKPLFYLITDELSSLRGCLYGLASSDDFSPLTKEAMIHSLLYSEIEGSLSIENVPSTRKRIIELVQKDAEPASHNDVIIKNMSRGFDFILKKPSFEESNLAHLYALLSENCLDEEDKLLKDHLYRHDEVEIDGYNGCPHQTIKQCMDSLFVFVNSNLKNPKLKHYLPHIAHYYTLYVHPYFDYNGRTARMVSLWIELLSDNICPLLISEGIDLKKKGYYSALENSRDARNDLTYFLEYIYATSIDYCLCYKNLEIISQNLQNKGITWTESEFAYFKKILLSYKGKFTYRDFLKFTKSEMSKQAALKVLNKYVSYGLLSSEESQSKTKLFDLKKDCLTYLTSNLRGDFAATR